MAWKLYIFSVFLAKGHLLLSKSWRTLCITIYHTSLPEVLERCGVASCGPRVCMLIVKCLDAVITELLYQNVMPTA